MKINPCIESVEMNYFTKYFNDKNSPIKTETLHEHDNYELFVMLKGEITYHVAGTDYFPQSTQIIVVPPRVKHKITINSDNSQHPLIRGINIRFNLVTDEINDFFRQMFSSPLVMDAKPYPEIIVLIHNIARYDALFTKTELDFLKLGLTNQLILLMYKYSAYYVRSDENVNHATTHVVSYINQHLTEKITVQSIADNFKFSERYIARIFKKDMGKTIHEYISDRRLTLARTLIFGGEKPTQAMFKSGFTDYPNFYRIFTKRYGISPRKLYVKYRNEAISRIQPKPSKPKR